MAPALTSLLAFGGLVAVLLSVASATLTEEVAVVSNAVDDSTALKQQDPVADIVAPEATKVAVAAAEHQDAVKAEVTAAKNPVEVAVDTSAKHPVEVAVDISALHGLAGFPEEPRSGRTFGILDGLAPVAAATSGLFASVANLGLAASAASNPYLWGSQWFGYNPYAAAAPGFGFGYPYPYAPYPFARQLHFA